MAVGAESYEARSFDARDLQEILAQLIEQKLISPDVIAGDAFFEGQRSEPAISAPEGLTEEQMNEITRLLMERMTNQTRTGTG